MCPCILLETKGYELLRYMTGAEFCSASESVPVCLVFCQNETVFSIRTLVVHLVNEIQQNVGLKRVELLLKVKKLNLCRAVLWSAAESIAGVSCH